MLFSPLCVLCCSVLRVSQVRAEDEEVFEMNPIEYIRRDRCGNAAAAAAAPRWPCSCRLPPANAAELFIFLVHSSVASAVQSERANASNLLQPVEAAVLGTVLHLYQPHGSVAVGSTDELGVLAPWRVLLLWLVCASLLQSWHKPQQQHSQGTMRVCSLAGDPTAPPAAGTPHT